MAGRERAPTAAQLTVTLTSRRTTTKKRSRASTAASSLPLAIPLASRTRRLPRPTTLLGGALPPPPASFPTPSIPLLYTAQDVARFCEVDLKTIHHWADAGKIPHHRTEGRHLRFRRNHILRFLHLHGYPLPAELVSVRPTIFVALPPADLSLASSANAAPAITTTPDELAKKLAPMFFVRRFENALSAIAHLALGEPDAIVLSLDDVTWAPAHTHAIAALKADPTTSWILLVVVSKAARAIPADEEDASIAGAVGERADLVLEPGDLGRLPAELATRLDVA